MKIQLPQKRRHLHQNNQKHQTAQFVVTAAPVQHPESEPAEEAIHRFTGSVSDQTQHHGALAKPWTDDQMKHPLCHRMELAVWLQSHKHEDTADDGCVT